VEFYTALGEYTLFSTLYSDKNGSLFEDERLGFLGRSGQQWIEAEERDFIPLPEGSSLVMMPGHFPVGVDSESMVSCREETPHGAAAVVMACLLPQGFTRTLLPATAAPRNTAEIPILGYTAVAGQRGEVMAAAIPTDEHRKWHPVHYNTPDLEQIVQSRLDQFPGNRILRQLAHCSLHYSCFTAQNIFYQRWEGGIPTTAACNARCLGCISEGHTSVSSPQERLGFKPNIGEIVEVALPHLERAAEGIISFGQGCEGDPVLNADLIASAIETMRKKTDRGCINVNTNAGYAAGVKKLVDAGLDAIRVTMLSASEKDYLTYHRPMNYGFQDVVDSISYAHANGVCVSLNLLTIPGFTDSEEQIEEVIRLVHKTGVPMIQLRNLNIDPDMFFATLPPRSEAIGVRQMIEVFRQEGIRVASYTHPARRR
jgi:pyruvate-formate lyase-activating enzyme